MELRMHDGSTCTNFEENKQEYRSHRYLHHNFFFVIKKNVIIRIILFYLFSIDIVNALKIIEILNG